jgi:hypothetical protein
MIIRQSDTGRLHTMRQRGVSAPLISRRSVMTQFHNFKQTFFGIDILSDPAYTRADLRWLCGSPLLWPWRNPSMRYVPSTCCSKCSTCLPALPRYLNEAPTPDPLSSPPVGGTSPHLHTCDSNPLQLSTAARYPAYPPLQKENGP